MSFNPVLSISGNGVVGQVTATFTTGSSFWNIQSQGLNGQVTVGSFPNSLNPYPISQQTINLTWPIRGGKNIGNTGIRNITQAGIVGITAVGIPIYNSRSGITVSGLNSTVFNLNSVEAKIQGEDQYGGKPTSTGQYNYRDADFITNNAWGSISGSTWAGGVYTQAADGHSKLIGWARDGYPIYGPYGYQTPLDIFSPVVRMESGYQLNLSINRPISRNLVVNGAVNSSTQFNVYSAAGVTVGMSLNGGGLSTSTKVVSVFGSRITTKTPVTLTQGSIITASYDPGVFEEDWTHYYSNGLVLDTFNGRYCVTPEYPNGTYAYFITTDATDRPTYPYTVGPRFFGSTIIDSTDTSLLSLVPQLGVLQPPFSSTITEYFNVVENPNTSTRFIATLNTPLSTLKFNNQTITSGVSTPYVPLIVGLNTSTFEVTSQFLTKRTYRITIERVRKSGKNLSSLTVSQGTLAPAFNASETSYAVTYNTPVSAIDIIATPADVESTISINGIPTLTGQSRTVNLSYGLNNIPIVVTAENLSTQTYTISATRLSPIAGLNLLETNRGILSPSFTSTNFLYFLNVVNTVTDISILANPVDTFASIFIEGIQTSNNTYSSPINLTEGNNPIGVKVISSDGTVRQDYRLIVRRQLSSTSTIASISLNEGILSPSFNSNTFNYVATVTNSVATLVITAVPNKVGSLITAPNYTIVGNDIFVPLNFNTNTVSFSCISPDRTTTSTYNFTVTRQLSNVSSLSELLLDRIPELDPVFNFGTFNYTANVPHTVTATSVVAFKTNSSSTIVVANQVLENGQKSNIIPLNVGANSIITTVTAQDNINTSTYTVTVTRSDDSNTEIAGINTNAGPISPQVSSTITNYTLTVPHSISTLNLDIILFNQNASVSVVKTGSILLPEDPPLTTSTGIFNTFNIPLQSIITGPGAYDGLTSLSINVQAADGVTNKLYSLNVTRLPSPVSTLTNLSINVPGLEPEFAHDLTEYYTSVVNTVTDVRVIASATNILQQIIINGTETPSGTLSNPIPIGIGYNSIPVLVIAGDPNYSTGYNIFINRAVPGLSTNSKLSLLTASIGNLYPAFTPNRLNYNLDLETDDSKVRIRATAEITQSIIKINGVPLLSGSFSNEISVNPGYNTITIVSTAQDAVSKTTYTIDVFRKGKELSSLTNLISDSGYFDTVFIPSDLSYTINVDTNIETIRFKPFSEDPLSPITINDLPAVHNTWSNPIKLNLGINTILVKVYSNDFDRNGLGNRVTVYTLKVLKEIPLVTDPAELFLTDGVNLNANFVIPDILRVYSKINTAIITTGTFPNPANTWTTQLQDLEFVYPYRGGTNAKSLTETPVAAGQNIGITVAGIPIKSPVSNVKITGLNSTTWTVNYAASGVIGIDQYGGTTGPQGYFYLTNKFLYGGGWDITPEWHGQNTFPNGHSRIIGFSADGYPIYGPYGYSTPTSYYSTATLMVSAYSVRDNPNRPESFTINYTGNELGADKELASIAGVKLGMRVTGDPISSTSTVVITAINTVTNYVTINPNVVFSAFAYELTVSYPLGYFVEDFYYNPDKLNRTLDIHNGRYCVTPEYPFGTYAYFSTGLLTPEYPYFVGESFYAPLLNLDTSEKTSPKWISNAGFIVTATEGVFVSRPITAVGSLPLSYKVIAGKLPTGLNLNTSTGIISGTPNLVYQTETYKFIIRSQNQYGLADRQFIIDVIGDTPPTIRTPGPILSLGPSGENYIINGQIVDFQFTASTDILPAGKNLFFFIAEGDGQLPPGLTLTPSGRLIGRVTATLSLFARSGTDGRFGVEPYDVNPYEHRSIQEYGVVNKFVNQEFRFFLSVSNGIAVAKAQYQISVTDPATFIRQV